MATAAKKTASKAEAPAKSGKTTALVRWDEALAARAKMQSKVAKAASGGGNFVSFKGGHLSFKGGQVADDVLDVVVVDSVMENQLYPDDFDEDRPQAPLCYAFGRDLDEIAPHPDVVAAGNAQAERCKDCEHNQWGSAAKGRGKACKNVFRLGIITAEEAETAKKVKEAEIVFVKTPVTSGKNWGNYVRQLEAQNLPPLAFVTQMEVVPAAKQFQVTFKALDKITDGEVIGALLTKADELEKTIDFPYPPIEEAPAKPAKKQVAVRRAGATQAAPAKKPAVKRAAKY
jgi:hypothetical protein